MERILLFVILILIGILIFSRGSIESFDDFFNPVQNIANITRPPPISAAQIQAASRGVTTKNQQYLANVYEQPDQVEPFELQIIGSDKPIIKTGDAVNVGTLASQSPDFTIAQTVCEPVNTIDCNAFDNENFRKNCGISFDTVNGTNSKGDSHVGGLYMDPARKAQLMEAQKKYPTRSYTFGPLYGSAGPALFAHDKPTCKYIQDDIKCKASRAVGVDNCAVCFSDFSFHATDPANPNGELTFVFYTNASELFIVVYTSKKQDVYVLRTPAQSNSKVSENVTQDPTVLSVNGRSLTTTTITNVSIQEGDQLVFIANNYDSVKDQVIPFSLGGYLQATTTNGEFKIDINAVIETDSGRIPNVGGDVNGYTLYNNIRRSRMELRGLMPFTFKGSDTTDSRLNCPNGPFITTAESMSYLETNEPCYGIDAKPGNYKLECLQQIFLSSGGATKGTGYPGTQETAQVLLVDETGKPRSLDQIGKFLYAKMVTGSTGLKEGQKVPITEWDEASMFMTGVPKAGPCDTAEDVPLSTECLTSLYIASGCFPKGKLNPDPAAGNPMTEGVAAGMSMGGAQGKVTVSGVYKNARDYANSTGIDNKTRQRALMDCYGIPILQTTLPPKLAGRVTVSGFGYINMSQLVVKDTNGFNVAMGGDTSKTNGGAYQGNTTPSVAVDGTEAARYHPTIYHSQRDDADTTFEVKLTKPSLVTQIIYYGRLGCCPERNQQIITVYDSVTDKPLWTSPRMTKEVVQTFNIPASVFQS